MVKFPFCRHEWRNDRNHDLIFVLIYPFGILTQNALLLQAKPKGQLGASVSENLRLVINLGPCLEG